MAVRRKVVGRSAAAAGRRGAVALAAVVAAVGLAGCSSEPSQPSDPEGRGPGSATPAPVDQQGQSGGMGVPQLAPADAPGRAVPLVARVEVSGSGCFLARVDGDAGRLLVIWPDGTEIGSRGDQLVLGSGATVTDQAVVRGRGAVVPVRSLPSYAEDGYWAYAVDYCTPGAGRVLVLTEALVD